LRLETNHILPRFFPFTFLFPVWYVLFHRLHSLMKGKALGNVMDKGSFALLVRVPRETHMLYVNMILKF